MAALNLKFRRMKKVYLQTLHDLSEGVPYREVKWWDLNNRLLLKNDEVLALMAYFGKTNFVEYNYPIAQLTSEGAEEIEKNMESTYAEKEYHVLKTIYDMGKNSPRNEIEFEDLLQAMGMSFQDLTMILEELYDRKKYLGESSDGTVKVSPAGLEFLESKSNFNQNRNITNYTTNISSNYGNVQIGGEGNKQNITD